MKKSKKDECELISIIKSLKKLERINKGAKR